MGTVEIKKSFQIGSERARTDVFRGVLGVAKQGPIIANKG